MKILRFFFLVFLSLSLDLGDDYSQVSQGSSSRGGGRRVCRSYGNRVPQDERNLCRVAPRRRKRRSEEEKEGGELKGILKKGWPEKANEFFSPFDSPFDENDQRAGTMRLMKRKRKKEEKEERKKKQHLHTRIDPTATDYNPVIRRREYDLRRFSLSLSPRSAFITSLVFFSIGLVLNVYASPMKRK